MNQAIFDEARAALSSGAISLTKLHELLKNAGSTWSESQHHLFFLAFDGFSVDRSGDQVMIHMGEQSPKERLVTEIEKVVESYGGKPVPAKEIKKRLPKGIVTTDEQVKAIARFSEKIEVYGPGLIRKK